MKIVIQSIIVFFCIAAQNGFSQVPHAVHEKPVIADAVPNIPEELLLSGKLSKYVALSLPDDDRWNPDNIILNANGAVFAIAQGDSRRSCFIGGHFDSISGIAAKRLAFLDDNAKTFSEVGGGIQGGDVYSIINIPYSNELYVAGNFTKAGNINAHCIAHWTGSNWESLGSGTDSTILAMAFVGSALYVGGNFHIAGGQTANYIAVWDTTGKKWLPVMDGTVNGMDGGVAAITLASTGDLYVGGGFTKAGTLLVNKIAVLSGGKWQALGNGMEGLNAFVTCIAINRNDQIYVGGNFESAGGMTANNIATLSGNIWQIQSAQFIKGFDKSVYTISTAGGFALFAGGDFTKFGDSNIKFIADLQGFGPLAMGSGLSGSCYALVGEIIPVSIPLTIWDQHLYVGGAFTEAGLKPSQNFAIWGTSSSDVKQNPSLASQVALHISPNPIQTSASLSFTLPQRLFTSVSIVDALGREVISLGSGWREAGVQEMRFDVKNLPGGAYYCRLQAEGQIAISTFIVTR